MAWTLSGSPATACGRDGEHCGNNRAIGSTSVPGLPAKPIIDIDVLLSKDRSLIEATRCLARLGYTHEGDLGIPGREAFKALKNDPLHHLYVCIPGSKEFERHLAFRNYLRANPADARIYGELKKSLAMKFREDRGAYTARKSAIVASLTDRAFEQIENLLSNLEAR